MIIFKFSAGLGNQLYEYAMFRYLQMQYGAENIRADISDYKGIKYHNGFELIRIFGDEIKQRLNPVSGWEYLWHTGQIPQLSPRFCKIVIYANRHLKRMNLKGRIVEDEVLGNACNVRDMLDILGNLDCKRDKELIGYWILPDYHNTYLKNIVEELKFPVFESRENTEISKIIKHSNSVSVHIRRGDYVGTKYDVLTNDYYENAMDYITRRVSNITWFFFSDDVEYVEEKYAYLENKYVIGNNVGCNSFRDMQLMSMCKHNIIANSTFSEWGAIFNKNSEKIVIYPSLYEKKRPNREKNWKGWIRL